MQKWQIQTWDRQSENLEYMYINEGSQHCMDQWAMHKNVQGSDTLFFRKSEFKDTRIQATVSQLQKWITADRSRTDIPKQERVGERKIKTSRPVVEHQTAIQQLSKNEYGSQWPTFAHACDGQRHLEGLLWARYIGPLRPDGPFLLYPMLFQTAMHELRSLWDSRPYVQYVLFHRCHSQCMTTYMLGQKMIRNQENEVLMLQVCLLLGSEQS